LQYARCWTSWNNFCGTHEIPPLQANENHVIAYLAYIASTCSDGVSTAYAHLSGIAYNYRLKGLPSVTDSTGVQMYIKGLKRSHAGKTVHRAEPMRPEILAKMREHLRAHPTLVTWRTTWAAHMEFVLMLRFDDLKRLTTNELKFEENKTGRFIRLKLIGTNIYLLKKFIIKSKSICRRKNYDVTKESQGGMPH